MAPMNGAGVPFAALVGQASREALTDALLDDALAASAADALPDPLRAERDPLAALWEQYDAIARSIEDAQLGIENADVLVVTLPEFADLLFTFLRADPYGRLITAYETRPPDGRCQPLSARNDALIQRAVESRALVAHDEWAMGASDALMLPVPEGPCAACPARPRGYTLVMPVLWRGEVLGVCHVVRCGDGAQLRAAEAYCLARLSETLAATEKYRALRLLRMREMREVARKEHELYRLARRLRLSTSVACDVAYAIDLSTGRFDAERTGTELPVGEMPPSADPVEWWLARVHPEDLPRVRAELARAQANAGVTCGTEYRVVTVGGTWRHVRHQLMIDPGGHGEPPMHAGALKDISGFVEARRILAGERAQLEHLVEERTADLTDVNADLERAARAKDEFLAAMSHELRTPLNAILGMTEATREGVWGPLTDSQDEKLALVEESGQHLLSLINDILDLAKIGAGKLKPEFAAQDVVGQAEAALRLVEQLARERSIRIERDLPAEAVTIETDGRMVRQILLNLLNNAVKFTDAGGRVRCEVGVDTAREAVVIRVSDTGIGMTAEEMTRIFRPFEQVHQGLARPYGGTGLGLALVAKLAEVLGGAVDVESVRGVGSTFTVRLPRRIASPGASSAPDIAPAMMGRRSGGSPLTVLLAEDDGGNVKTFLAYLTAKGFRVEVARDGEEALEKARALHPALILMDIQMPRLDGVAAIRQLRTEPQFSDTPIIALTAHAMSGDRERILRVGATDYVTKPIALRALRDRIAGYIGMPEGGVPA
ncbi:MAG: response regulator [Gemmatimonadota bacterium]|nr:response regulator [Gemmatimonadota bacterium]